MLQTTPKTSEPAKPARTAALATTLLVSLTLTALPCLADGRQVRGALEAAIASTAAEGVAVRVNEGLDSTLRIGDDVRYRFEATRDGHLTAFYVDSHGVVTVLFPGGGDSRLGAGHAIDFPPEGLALEVTPPVGTATVFALVTPEPLSHAALGLPDNGGIAVVEATEAVQMANRLRDHLGAYAPGQVRSTRFEQRVIGREDTQYTVGDVVAYMGRTRAIRRPSLDLHLRFAFDSAEITEEGRRSLDVVGKSLAHSELRGERFVLSGHTDDLGDESYNESLSRARATAARAYLIETWAADPGRIAVHGYGEAKPLEDPTDDEARAMNRRVELELVR